jgi:ferredoxin
MTKILRAKFPNKCTGCELCVAEVQRQLGKVGIDGALIRVFRTKKENSEYLEFRVEIDPRIKSMDMEMLLKICPNNTFEIVEE